MFPRHLLALLGPQTDSLGYIQKLKEEFGAVHAPIDITYEEGLWQGMLSIRAIKGKWAFVGHTLFI